MHKLPEFIRLTIVAVCLALATLTAPAQAVEPDEILTDPALEARARSLSTGLRCLVCQNQSIDDSNAPLARDLRLLVRERLKAGDSDSKIIDYIVARYGEFVLLKPRFGGATIALWLAPLLVLTAGGLLAWNVFRRHSPLSDTLAPLSSDEEARLAEILKEPARSKTC
jgi:cytochrome c-type biogenesis protein CcmH